MHEPLIAPSLPPAGFARLVEELDDRAEVATAGLVAFFAGSAIFVSVGHGAAIGGMPEIIGHGRAG